MEPVGWLRHMHQPDKETTLLRVYLVAGERNNVESDGYSLHVTALV